RRKSCHPPEFESSTTECHQSQISPFGDKAERSRHECGRPGYSGDAGRHCADLVRDVIWPEWKRPGWPVVVALSPIQGWQPKWLWLQYQLLLGKSWPVHIQRAAGKTRAALPEWVEPPCVVHLFQDAHRRRQRRCG